MGKMKEAGTCPEGHVSQEWFDHKVCPECEAFWAALGGDDDEEC